MSATIEDPLGKPDGIYDLIIEAKSPHAACASGAKVFWSAIPGVDSWPDFRLLAIASDRKSFVFANSIGVQMSAKVGDDISREDDRVIRISTTAVTVMRLEPDGAGGWKEVERQLTFEPTKETK